MSWNQKFMGIANDISKWSKDKSTGVGAVIVKHNRIISTGYNGFPEHISDKNIDRHSRPAKYSWTVHAEENAIISAARVGVSTDGAIMYYTWFPCAGCARMIVNAGISKIVCGRKPDLSNEKFGKEFEIAIEMLHEADVDIEYEILNTGDLLGELFNKTTNNDICGCGTLCNCDD